MALNEKNRWLNTFLLPLKICLRTGRKEVSFLEWDPKESHEIFKPAEPFFLSIKTLSWTALWKLAQARPTDKAHWVLELLAKNWQPDSSPEATAPLAWKGATKVLQKRIQYSLFVHLLHQQPVPFAPKGWPWSCTWRQWGPGTSLLPPAAPPGGLSHACCICQSCFVFPVAGSWLFSFTLV